MNFETGTEAILAAIGVEIAKMVVEQYLNNKSNKENSARIQDESALTDKSIKEVSDEK